MPLGVAPTPYQAAPLPSLSLIAICLSAACAFRRLLRFFFSSSLDIDDFYCLLDPISVPGPSLMFLLCSEFFPSYPRLRERERGEEAERHTQRNVCSQACFVVGLLLPFLIIMAMAIKIYMKNSPNYENAIKVMQVNDRP